MPNQKTWWVGSLLDKSLTNCGKTVTQWKNIGQNSQTLENWWRNSGRVLVLAARGVDSADGGLNNPPRIFDLSSRSTLITLLLMMMDQVITDLSLDHPSAPIPEQAQGFS